MENEKLGAAVSVANNFAKIRFNAEQAINAITELRMNTGTYAITKEEETLLRNAANAVAAIKERASEWNAMKYILDNKIAG